MTDIDQVIAETWRQDALAGVLPFESWEPLAGESTAAYGAFCVYRDYGPERNIRKAVLGTLDKDDGESGGAQNTSQGGHYRRRYQIWRARAMQYKWRERAADYDRYLDRMKQAEIRKTIEEQGKTHREITGKMLRVVGKKLDLMNPEDLKEGTVHEWVETAVRVDREAGHIADADPASRNSTLKDGQITFIPEFEGL
ncbi:hypothetical protein FACS1894140_1730 [Spirochaetia bacterium]|nr:hypothetical protein FACS1894140_1730 [Spirochaetia bacterium]